MDISLAGMQEPVSYPAAHGLHAILSADWPPGGQPRIHPPQKHKSGTERVTQRRLNLFSALHDDYKPKFPLAFRRGNGYNSLTVQASSSVVLSALSQLHSSQGCVVLVTLRGLPLLCF